MLRVTGSSQEPKIVPEIKPLPSYLGSWQVHPEHEPLMQAVQELLVVKTAILEGEQWLHSQLPWVQWERSGPSVLRVMVLFGSAAGHATLQFLTELATQWLITGRELPLLSCGALCFELPQIGKSQYSYAEVAILIHKPRDFALCYQELPFLLGELKLVAQRQKCARHLLEGRRLGLGRKNCDVHQAVLRLNARMRPETTLATMDELHKLLLLCESFFWAVRPASLLARIASSFLFLEPKLIRGRVASQQGARVRLRLLHAQLCYPFGSKRVLGICLAVRLDPTHELLEEEHVRKALKRVIAGAEIVRGSFVKIPAVRDQIVKFYFEADFDGRLPTRDERKALQMKLPNEIEESIEQLINSVFVQRNEEQLLRGIITLCREVQVLNDPPIMMTEFYGQEGRQLIFSVILVRPLVETSPLLKDALARLPSSIGFALEEERIVGSCSQGGKKAASVFRLSLEKAHFLRKDQSIDLPRAQQHLINMIQKVLGEVRDFRGVLVDQRAEDLECVKALLSDEERHYEHLLENIFHSLSPAVMQSYLPAATIYAHFGVVMQARRGQGRRLSRFKILAQTRDGFFHLVVSSREEGFGRVVLSAVSALGLAPLSYAHASFDAGEEALLTFIHRVSHEGSDQQLQLAVERALEGWERRIRSRQILRLNLPQAVVSLDPRVGTDRRSGVLMRMLYEGLMRMGRDGRPALGCAERVDISPDRKTYTFFLRSCQWSDGTALTAYDYEYAWKKALDPGFQAVRAFLFSPIKNAMRAKRGEAPIDSVGVRVVGERQLVVDLEKPTPYFLDLTSHWSFAPVPYGIDARQPGWAALDQEGSVGNGPFMLDEWNQGQIRVVKNPRYWDAESVSLNALELVVIDDPHAAYREFEQGNLDWVGEPLSELPLELIPQIQREGRLHSVPIAALHWYKLNTRVPPFKSRSMRKAFAYALDRRQLIEEARWGDEEPALSFLPAFLALARKGLIRDGDVEGALVHFKRGLNELGMTKEELEPLVLSHSSLQMDRAVVQAAAAQWEQCFGLRVELQEIPWHSYLNFTLTQDFVAAAVTWYSWFNDPIYTLQHLKRRGANANATGWEDPRFIDLLDQAEECLDLEKRRETMRNAEELLLEEMPLIPVCAQRHRYVKRDDVKDVRLSPLGQVDFRWAYIDTGSLKVKDQKERLP